MQFPFFYIPVFDASQKTIVLDEDTSRHVVQVLRMKEGEKLNLTDGKGHLVTTTITDAHKKHCQVAVQTITFKEPDTKKVCIAISLIKNASRFEWFLEKATEIGVSEIIPLQCERTVKERFRYDRMQSICVSAMLQSQQVWLPVLQEPVQFENIATWKAEQGSNFIAHCEEGNKQPLQQHIHTTAHQLICIGPEGDFSPAEIELAIKEGFIPVAIGEKRLRTETAGVVAAALLCINS
jgi:16S rRNA (uracil1498-N3)-methyltransferase